MNIDLQSNDIALDNLTDSAAALARSLDALKALPGSGRDTPFGLKLTREIARLCEHLGNSPGFPFVSELVVVDGAVVDANADEVQRVTERRQREVAWGRRPR